MPIELRDLETQRVLQLPDDLLWVDEHLWTPAISNVSYLLTGALLIESATRQSGRPITLQAPDDMAWVKRSLVDQLYGWAAEPGHLFELRLANGRSSTVMFRHQDQALDCAPVLGFGGLDPESRWRVVIRLMEVAV
jgi:hypothetical protein